MTFADGSAWRVPVLPQAMTAARSRAGFKPANFVFCVIVVFMFFLSFQATGAWIVLLFGLLRFLSADTASSAQVRAEII
jgi:hypothetical protein